MSGKITKRFSACFLAAVLAFTEMVPVGYASGETMEEGLLFDETGSFYEDPGLNETDSSNL